MADPVNLFAREVRGDPFPTYARLRSAPVQRVEPMGIWAVSRHEDVEHVLKNPETFSSAGFGAVLKPAWLGHNPMADSLATMDGLGHAKLRAILSRAFTPRGVARFEPRIRAIAAELAERLRARGECDFVAELAAPLAGRVIAEAVGIDPALSVHFRRWVGHIAMVSPMYPGDEIAAAIRASIGEIDSALHAVVAARRREPMDDMVSDLVRAEVSGVALTDEEIVAFVCTLVPAGFETSMHLLALLVIGFAERPEDLTRLREDPSLIPAYIEESLRRSPPVHGVPRITTVDTVLGGVPVPAGSMVLALIGSANRDAARHAEPERFDPSRGSQGGVAFGHGVHFCLGASLARLEARVALEELVRRVRGFERLHGELEWNVAVHVRGPMALPVRVLPA
jgi:cytochrome P450